MTKSLFVCLFFAQTYHDMREDIVWDFEESYCDGII